MRKLLLECEFSPGDLVMLSAAIRDLHRSYPGAFLTAVRTPCPEIWDNNSYLTCFAENDPEVEVIKCDVPLINRSNQVPYHYIHAFVHFLNERLSLRIEPTDFKGDIHISRLEKSWWSQVHELSGEDTPFWIVSAGGKFDVTIKWWESSRYQKVIDHFRGKILFVQVGKEEHYHPKLEGVVDLRGKTTLRELIRLVYHSQGVLCGVTCLMHLAAAIEAKPGQPTHRPCVVIAGGREPVHWEAYSHHQYIHTIGALSCCQKGGCWRNRTEPLLDGRPEDRKKNRCLQPVGTLPRCMDMITPDEVIRRIELYFEGGSIKYLSAGQRRGARKAVPATRVDPLARSPLTEKTARGRSELFLREAPAYPGNFEGRGIVICAGGVMYFPAAWVCIRMLRQLGCHLPIQLWHLGKFEFSSAMEKLVSRLGVECVDASEVRKQHPARILNGWELKPYAILHCWFKEVLLLDADNMPVRNPEYLFETEEYEKTGAVFWPDIYRPEPPEKVWEFCGIKYRRERNFDSGQILVNKEKTWRALSLAMWYNENSDFFYRHVFGDKETFHLAFRKTGHAYAMPKRGVHRLPGTMCQHDFQGRRVFQHRNTDVWNLFLLNRRVKGFRFEPEARGYVEELRSNWDGELDRYPREVFQPRNRDPAGGARKIEVWMISCPERKAIREQTLERLNETDWGDSCAPDIRVQMDDGGSSDKKQRIVQVYRHALTGSLEGDAEYTLVLEDDLIFNRFFWKNLRNWEPLRQGYLDFGSFYNPGIPPRAGSASGQYWLADPNKAWGSQAFIYSREWIKYLLAHWEDRNIPADLRIPRLAGDAAKPIFYHMPSLVQHAGKKSTWGGVFHQARDFDAQWKACEE